jgi:hypothetical protein
MQHRSLKLRKTFVLLPAAAAVALALAGCGGGGGGGPSLGAASTSLSGAAIDAPIAGATITITSGAPLVDGGTSIGSITADSQGGFTISVNLPTGSVPVFANAVAPNTSAGTTLELSSYLGQSDALAAAGALTTSNLPDLDISPVSTAALAVFARTNGGSFSNLTPASYATTLATYRNDILAIAAAIKAVGDNLCTPATPVTSTTDLAATIAQNATLSATNTASTTLATAAATLGGNCATVLPALQTAILADDRFGPELDLGDLIEANVQAVLPGTYSLQSVIAETPVSQSVNTQTTQSGSVPTVSTINPAEVFVDNVTVDASGNVTSTDNAVSGTLYGNLLRLQIKDPSGNVYQLRTKVGSLPTALSSGQQAYNVQGGGVNTASQALTMFSADLVPTTAGTAALPQWDAYWNNGMMFQQMGSEDSGVRGCVSGSLPVRFDLSAMFTRRFMSDDSFSALAECVAPTAGSSTSWTMSPAIGMSFEEYSGGSLTTGYGATLTQTGQSGGMVVWNAASSPTPSYVMQANDVTLTPPAGATPISGSAYYVLGSRSVVVSPLAGASNPGSAILNIQGRFLSQLSESSRNSSDGEQSMSQGDH